jgi:hypothetical protein
MFIAAAADGEPSVAEIVLSYFARLLLLLKALAVDRQGNWKALLLLITCA